MQGAPPPPHAPCSAGPEPWPWDPTGVPPSPRPRPSPSPGPSAAAACPRSGPSPGRRPGTAKRTPRPGTVTVTEETTGWTRHTRGSSQGRDRPGGDSRGWSPRVSGGRSSNCSPIPPMEQPVPHPPAPVDEADGTDGGTSASSSSTMGPTPDWPRPASKQPRTDLDELMGWLAGLVPGTDTAAQKLLYDIQRSARAVRARHSSATPPSEAPPPGAEPPAPGVVKPVPPKPPRPATPPQPTVGPLPGRPFDPPVSSPSRPGSCPRDTRHADTLRGQCLALVQELRQQQDAESALVRRVLEGRANSPQKAEDSPLITLHTAASRPSAPASPAAGKAEVEVEVVPRPPPPGLSGGWNAALEDLEGRHRATLVGLRHRHLTDLWQCAGWQAADLRRLEAELRGALGRAEAEHRAQLHRREADLAALQEASAALEAENAALRGSQTDEALLRALEETIEVLRVQLEAQEREAGPTTAPPKAVGVDVSTQSDPASSLGSLWSSCPSDGVESEVPAGACAVADDEDAADCPGVQCAAVRRQCAALEARLRELETECAAVRSASKSQLRAQKDRLETNMALLREAHRREIEGLVEEHELSLQALTCQVDALRLQEEVLADSWREECEREVADCHARSLCSLEALEAHERRLLCGVRDDFADWWAGLKEDDAQLRQAPQQWRDPAPEPLVEAAVDVTRWQYDVWAAVALPQEAPASGDFAVSPFSDPAEAAWLADGPLTARLGVWQAEAQGRAAVEVAEAVAWRDVRCEGDAGPQSGVEREALRRQLARLQGMMDSCLAESRASSSIAPLLAPQLQAMQFASQRELCLSAAEHRRTVLAMEEEREWAALAAAAKQQRPSPSGKPPAGDLRTAEAEVEEAAQRWRLREVGLRERYERRLLLQQEEAERQAERLRCEYGAATQRLLADSTAVVLALRAEGQRERQALGEAHARELAALHASMETTVVGSPASSAASHVSHSEEGETLPHWVAAQQWEDRARELEDQLLALQRETAVWAAETQVRHEAELQGQEEQHRGAMEELQRHFQTVVEEVRQDHFLAVQRLEAHYCREMEAVWAAHDADVTRLQGEGEWSGADVRPTPAGPADPVRRLRETYRSVRRTAERATALLSPASDPSQQSPLSSAVAELRFELEGGGRSPAGAADSVASEEQDTPGGTAAHRSHFSLVLETTHAALEDYTRERDVSLCSPVSPASSDSGLPSLSPIPAPPPRSPPRDASPADAAATPLRSRSTGTAVRLRQQLEALQQQYWADMGRAQAICSAVEVEGVRVAELAASRLEDHLRQVHDFQAQLSALEVALLVASEALGRCHLAGRETEWRLQAWGQRRGAAEEQRAAAVDLLRAQVGAAAQELQRLRECHAAEVAALRREAEAERARLVAAHEADWEQHHREQQQALEGLLAETERLRERLAPSPDAEESADWAVEREALLQRIEELETLLAAAQEAQTAAEATASPLGATTLSAPSTLAVGEDWARQREDLLMEQDLLMVEKGNLQVEVTMLRSQLAELRKYCDALEERAEGTSLEARCKALEEQLRTQSAACHQLRAELGAQQAAQQEQAAAAAGLQRLVGDLRAEQLLLQDSLAYSDAEVLRLRAQLQPRHPPPGPREAQLFDETEELAVVRAPPGVFTREDVLEERLRVTDAHLRALFADAETVQEQQVCLAKEAALLGQKEQLLAVKEQLLRDQRQLTAAQAAVGQQRRAVRHRSVELERRLRKHGRGGGGGPAPPLPATIPPTAHASPAPSHTAATTHPSAVP